MKIALITNYWKNSSGGGVRTYVTNLVEEFKRRNNLQVHVLFREGNDIENERVGFKFLFPLKVFFSLRKFRPDIIYSQGSWFCLLAGVLYKLSHNVQLVHTFHTAPYESLPFFGKSFFQILLNKCDYVTFVSKDLENKIIDLWGLKFKKTKIIYAGVKGRQVSSDEILDFSTKFNIKDDSVILLSQGFTSYKLKAEGVKILILSIKEFISYCPNIILIVTGEGRYSRELKNFVESIGLNNNVIFTGNIENPYVPLAVCNIYTHISLGEGLPIALLEAMIMSKPIIATSVGGIPEAITDGVNGILVDPDNNQIIEAIENLLSHEEFSLKLGLNAKKIAEEKFQWETTANEYLKLY